ncbi:unnamed protein product [Lactuca saligna]|uniref:Uncharacterized protein n=1 Tax=Lactuca saligna TaxID=75948 RepID=A0AA36EBW6_LACSI|nr:unnamed protein product [Lactuca saligna]
MHMARPLHAVEEFRGMIFNRETFHVGDASLSEKDFRDIVAVEILRTRVVSFREFDAFGSPCSSGIDSRSLVCDGLPMWRALLFGKGQGQIYIRYFERARELVVRGCLGPRIMCGRVHVMTGGVVRNHEVD